MFALGGELFFWTLEIQDKLTRRFIELLAMKVARLFVIVFLFLGGSFVHAGPVGEFFKKVGQSVSKPFQSQPEPEPQSQPTRHQVTKAPHAPRRSSSRATPPAATTPSSSAQPTQGAKAEESPGPVRNVSAADLEKAKASLPYGIPVPGRKGMVTSPYTPEEAKYIDVTGLASGSVAKDPYTGKFFLVP